MQVLSLSGQTKAQGRRRDVDFCIAKCDYFPAPGRGNKFKDQIESHKLKIVVTANGICLKDKEPAGKAVHRSTATCLAEVLALPELSDRQKHHCDQVSFSMVQ